LLAANFVIVGLAGCHAWQLSAPEESGGSKSQSLLKPVGIAEDGFSLEIITVRFPLGDAELNQAAWSQIDEQTIPVDVRRRLADNGLRAGTIAGQLPAEVARIITEAEQPATLTEAAANFAQAPVVSRQRMQLHSGWRGQLLASKIYHEVSLLLREQNGEQIDVTGKPFRLAQGIFDVSAAATGDRRVKLHFTPELHHGEPRQAFVVESEDATLRPQASKQKKVFDNLAFEATLAGEQMLVIASLPDRPGTVGHVFLTEHQAEQLQQKMMIVRLEQSRYSDLFNDQKIAGDFPAVK
jgi:hypothetical protein